MRFNVLYALSKLKSMKSMKSTIFSVMLKSLKIFIIHPYFDQYKLDNNEIMKVHFWCTQPVAFTQIKLNLQQEKSFANKSTRNNKVLSPCATNVYRMYEINNFKRANTILNKVDAHMLLRFCFSHVYHKTHSFTATGNKIQALKSTNRESYRAGTILITNIIIWSTFFSYDMKLIVFPPQRITAICTQH